MGCLVSANVYPLSMKSAPTVAAPGAKGLASSAAGETQEKKLNLQHLKDSIRVPLTEREVFTVCKSWKSISQNMTSTGIAMFLR